MIFDMVCVTPHVTPEKPNNTLSMVKLHLRIETDSISHVFQNKESFIILLSNISTKLQSKK